MTKRRVIIFAGACVAVLCGVLWWAVATHSPAVPDPVYAGHPLSLWLDASPAGNASGAINAQLLLHSLDSNAVPYLVQALKVRNGRLRMAYERLWPNLPAWLKRYVSDPTSEQTTRFRCCVCLGSLGAAARPAIPELVRLLREDDSFVVRYGAVEALGWLARGDDKPVVEALVEAARKDTAGMVRDWAGMAVWHLDVEAAAKAGITNAGAGRWPATNSDSAGR